jgi:hypothetical protein
LIINNFCAQKAHESTRYHCRTDEEADAGKAAWSEARAVPHPGVRISNGELMQSQWIEQFVSKAFDSSNIKSLLFRIQRKFDLEKIVIIEVIWDTYPNGYFYPTRLEIRDQKAFKAFSGTIPERKFLVFDEEPAEEYFLKVINRDLVKWIVDVNFKKVEQYPIWKIPEYMKS